MKIIQTFLFETNFYKQIIHKLSSILKTEKTLKTLSSGLIYKKPKKPKKPKKINKKTKKKKKAHWAGFFFKPGFFPTLPHRATTRPAGRSESVGWRCLRDGSVIGWREGIGRWLDQWCAGSRSDYSGLLFHRRQSRRSCFLKMNIAKWKAPETKLNNIKETSNDQFFLSTWSKVGNEDDLVYRLRQVTGHRYGVRYGINKKERPRAARGLHLKVLGRYRYIL